MSDTQQAPRRAPSGVRIAAAFAATVVAAVPAVAYATHATSHRSHGPAIKAVLGSGVMTNTAKGFAPNKAVTRGQLASSLQRSMPRLALQSVSGSSAASSSSMIGEVTLRIGGAVNKNQAVVLSFNGQLDHDSQLAAGCFPSFSITRAGSPTVIASRTQELYGAPTGGLELPVSMSFLVQEKTSTTVTYQLTLTNPCSATLFLDGGDLTASNVVLNGGGKAMPNPAGQIQHTQRHDR
jgi:hypothetical protein